MKMPVLCAVAGLVLSSPVFLSAGTDEGGYEIIANANGFACEIPGCADASKNIREIRIDELNIDVREVTTGLDVEYRLYGPGAPHFGNATFTFASTPGGSKELQAWFLEAAKGKNIRKNITVRLFRSDKSPGRGYNLLGCVPDGRIEAGRDATTGEPTETLRVNIGRIELRTHAAPLPPGSSGGTGANPHSFAEASVPDKRVVGFAAEIAGQSGKEVDNAWESVSGGELIIELTDATTGGDKHKTNSPGHKSVGEITLRGAMTDKRAALCQWINDTVQGKPWKRTVTITELLSQDGAIKPGKKYTYFDCFPVGYVFPRMSVTNTTGSVMEEVKCRVIRWDSDLPPQLVGTLDIPGAPVASKDALAIAVDDMAMDVNLVPIFGDARDPQATVFLPHGSAFELMEWLVNAATGEDDPRDVTVEMRPRRTASHFSRIRLYGCYPVDYSVTNTTGNVIEEVRIKPIRFEME